MCYLGSNFLILNHANIIADVYPYNKSYEHLENVLIVTEETDYNDTITRATYIIVLNDSLYYLTNFKNIHIN